MLGVCRGSRTSHFQGPSRTSKRTAYAAPRQTDRPPQPSAYKIHAHTWTGLMLTHRPSYISHYTAPLITPNLLEPTSAIITSWKSAQRSLNLPGRKGWAESRQRIERSFADRWGRVPSSQIAGLVCTLGVVLAMAWQRATSRLCKVIFCRH